MNYNPKDAKEAARRAKNLMDAVEQVNRMYSTPRDADRIERIVDHIETLWKRYPDWRLSQLLLNISERHSPTFFYYEDSDLEDALVKWIDDPPIKGVEEVKTDKV